MTAWLHDGGAGLLAVVVFVVVLIGVRVAEARGKVSRDLSEYEVTEADLRAERERHASARRRTRGSDGHPGRW